MYLFSLAWKSLLNRRFSVLLTLFSIALSVALLLGVDRLRSDARLSFANTLTGTDLIVGARSGPVQLLLYSVFHLGDATNNLSWDSYQAITQHPKVAWAVPLSLGDSHRDFRVLGTSTGYFKHYHYGSGSALQLAKGRIFEDVYDAVLGAAVARKLGYELGQSIVLAHGANDVSFARHDDKPFRVVGILAPTGTPVDQTVHVSLEGIEAIHVDWKNGAPIPGLNISADKARTMNLEPETITAALVGLTSRIATFQVQRFINDYPKEPLSAVLPGVALDQLWGLISVAENALLIVSGFVVVVGLFGMLATLLTSLNERRREMAILRSVGARPGHIFLLILGETGVLTLLGIALGLLLLILMSLVAAPLVEAHFGIGLALRGLSPHELTLLGILFGSGLVIGLIPAWRAYRLSLADGLSQRL